MQTDIMQKASVLDAIRYSYINFSIHVKYHIYTTALKYKITHCFFSRNNKNYRLKI